MWDPYGNGIIKGQDSVRSHRSSLRLFKYPRASVLLAALKHPFRGTGLGGGEHRARPPPSPGKARAHTATGSPQMQRWQTLAAAGSLWLSHGGEGWGRKRTHALTLGKLSA